MTREEFVESINRDTVLGLRLKKTELSGLQALAKGYQRPDIAEIIDGVILALDVAITQAERLGVEVKEFS